jgi:hypothetical protein
VLIFTKRRLKPVYPELLLSYRFIMKSDVSMKLNKKAISTGRLTDASDEKAYWLSKSPNERIMAIETMRRIIYGYNPSSEGFQRVLEITQR